MDCFQGQPKTSGLRYAVDPGAASPKGFVALPGTEVEGFANAAVAISPATILKNLQEIQREQTVSERLKVTDVSKLNLDIEMETGTGKTYCYIKTMFELNLRYK